MSALLAKSHLTAILFLLVAICAARGAGADSTPPDARTLLAASGVDPARLEHYAEAIDELAQTLRNTHDLRGGARERARAIHVFLHDRVLRGKYNASASDMGAALDSGPFNCAAASGLFLSLAARCGLETQAVSVRGHVWCRVSEAGESFEVETTCHNWFEIADRYAGIATKNVSTAMADHRRRSAAARVLTPSEFLAIFYYNRGVTLLRTGQFAAAARANEQALALDPRCLPAQENLAAAQAEM